MTTPDEIGQVRGLVGRQIDEAKVEARLWDELAAAEAILKKPRMGRELTDIVMEQCQAMDKVIRVQVELARMTMAKIHSPAYVNRLEHALRERDESFDRANRAARESSQAWQKAEDLQTEFGKLREQYEMVYSDRTALQSRLMSIALTLGITEDKGSWDDWDYAHLTAAITHLIKKLQARPEFDRAAVSKMTFDARESIEMYADVVESQLGDKSATQLRRVVAELDSFRAAQGWSPHGFGGEDDGLPVPGA